MCQPVLRVVEPGVTIPEAFVNVQGPFTALTYFGEKCRFLSYCKNSSCVVKFCKCGIPKWPFDCGLFYKSGDYLEVTRDDIIDRSRNN